MKPNSPRSRLALRVLSLIFAGLLVGVVGCANPVEAPTAGVIAGSSASASSCDDVDYDGFGPGCGAGEDCDDEDPEVTSECYRCTEPGPGCPCEVEGSSLFCPHVVSHVGEQNVCGPGYAICQGGLWGDCVLNYTATAAGDSEH